MQLKFSGLYNGYHFWYMRSYPKIIRKLHLCAGCDKKETGCTRTSAANMLDLQYVSDGVHMGVSTFANGPDVYRCWSEDQCCILPWGASDSKANACYAWDLWRVLYLPARQCSCWPSLRDNQPSETRHLRSFHQTFCHQTAQIWTQFTIKYGDKSILQVHDVDELKQRLIDVWHHFEQSVIDDSVDQWRKCPYALICFKWRPFKH